MDKDRFEELVILYSLGSLDGKDLDEFESYMRENEDEVNRIISENEQYISLLGASVNIIKPEKRIKQELLRRIRKQKAFTTSSFHFIKSLNHIGYTVITIIVCTSLIIGIYIGIKVNNKQFIPPSYNTRLTNDEISRLIALVEEKDNRILSLKSIIQQQNLGYEKLIDRRISIKKIASYIRNPNVTIINLINVKQDLRSAGRILWDTSTQDAVFYTLNLPQTSPERNYQLWMLINNNFIIINEFDVNDKGSHIIMIQDLPQFNDVQKIVVTLETKGRKINPSENIYLSGTKP